MILRANLTIILEAQGPKEAQKLLTAWIHGLLDKSLIIEGEISFIERFETEDDPEPNEPLYDFKGFDNYPGHPI